MQEIITAGITVCSAWNFDFIYTINIYNTVHFCILFSFFLLFFYSSIYFFFLVFSLSPFLLFILPLPTSSLRGTGVICLLTKHTNPNISTSFQMNNSLAKDKENVLLRDTLRSKESLPKSPNSFLKKRSPTTPLTPSLVSENVMKKYRISDNGSSNKNLRNLEAEISDQERKESSRSSNHVKSGLNEEIFEAQQGMELDVDQDWAASKSQPKFDSFDAEIDFELYKVNQEISGLMKDRKLVRNKQIIEFLELERMFARN